jgi:transcriptional regulator with XRE-family HTH domain
MPARIDHVERELDQLDQQIHGLERRRDELEREYPWPLRFGSRIRHARTRHGFSQEMLARIAGLHPSTVSRIERGANRHGCDFHAIPRLAGALGVSCDWLFGRVGDDRAGSYRIQGQRLAGKARLEAPRQGQPTRRLGASPSNDEIAAGHQPSPAFL